MVMEQRMLHNKLQLFDFLVNRILIPLYPKVYLKRQTVPKGEHKRTMFWIYMRKLNTVSEIIKHTWVQI
jgi:hypothetical protein